VRTTLAGALLLGALLLGAALTTAAAPAPAAAGTRLAGPHPVVLVGIPGLLWTDISASATPNLWRLAVSGSVGNLVVYAVDTLTCPADGWLTLNSGARALAPRPASGRCGSLPPVIPMAAAGTSGTHGVPAPARVPAMPSLVSVNRQFSENPSWGLLARAARPGQCATAIGPGAALALAGPGGRIARYLPSASAAGRSAFSLCPLTVADLGAVPASRPSQAASRAAAVRADDRALGRIRAELPAGAILVVAALADGAAPHLHPVVVAGPGFGPGLLDSAATRQPGLVTLTDLAPTVLRWRSVPVPSGAVGSQLARAPRGSLSAAVRGLTGQDTATQVYASTFGWFFLAYGAAEAVVFGGIALISWGGQPERRRRRAALWRAAGVFAAAVPAGTYLASLVPWSLQPHPAAWLYAMTACWAAVIGTVALAGPWRRDPLGPLGMVAALTGAVIAADVITGSRLQLGTPFGLSVTTAGRFYGIGNHEIFIFAASGLFCAGWLAMRAQGWRAPGSPAPGSPAPGSSALGSSALGSSALGSPALGSPAPERGQGSTRTAVLAVAAVGLAVVAVSGWPGFGAKVGGTFAMVPAFAILLLGAAGLRMTPRRAAAAVACGAALVVLLALVNYFVPATGRSDIGGFFGQVLHGGAGGTLSRKITSNVASLTVAGALIVPPVIAAAGLVLLRPSWFAVRTLPRAWAARPLLRAILAAVWVMAVLGWFAEDSGVTVPAAGLPFVLPLAIAAASAVCCPRPGPPAATPAGRRPRQAILDLPP
jgi:hypothetical protein